MRVGRSALDESAIRLIEEHNPDVEFDWTRILKGQDAPVEQRPSAAGAAGQPRRVSRAAAPVAACRPRARGSVPSEQSAYPADPPLPASR